MGIDKDQIIKAIRYDGVMTTNIKMAQITDDMPINNTENSNNIVLYLMAVKSKIL